MNRSIRISHLMIIMACSLATFAAVMFPLGLVLFRVFPIMLGVMLGYTACTISVVITSLLITAIWPNTDK